MKYLMIVLVSILSLTSCDNANGIVIGDMTTMEVNTNFDAGDVVKGEMIEAKFIIKNTGSFPLHIGQVTPSCSCTISESPEAPILPGKTGEVKAYVNTDKLSAGSLHKSVRITANTNPSVTEVIISGNVIRK